ncbi:serine hydrolase [Natronospirillum operosum]|uniref:beta-lactamase n=1 Tax=Natronospirillum operosum TaxID=2759953 RepID=A0A4Z0WE30_9GAMM|nr:serine hydrolase [Natronospirillum operosum]TGG92393.1 serine hydrolase [Natronospirillum operosum]
MTNPLQPLVGVLTLALLAPLPALALDWVDRLESRLEVVDTEFSGDLSVYVAHTGSGESVSLRGHEHWYLASTIKVPVAIELLAQVDAGERSLDDQVALEGRDYVDGAGQTNWHDVGTEFTLEHLLQEMLVVSDNAASDMVIRTVGIDNVNTRMEALGLDFVGPITSLADVRRRVYGEFHDGAASLDGPGFFSIRQANNPDGRVDVLAEVLGVSRSEFSQPDLDSAFDAYYQTPYNSGTLSAMGQMMARLVEGELLSADSTDYLLDLLQTIETGDNRLRATLPDDARFAHKTGTQHRRACDIGAVLAENDRSAVVVAVCTRGPRSTAEAERAMRAVGEAVTESGVLDRL